MKVAIYSRVSKEVQTTEQQTETLKEYVVNHKDMELYDVYEDIITSISDTRPQLDRLMQDARQRKFTHVVFWKVDRLARKSLVFYQILDEWEKIGITYTVASLGIDTTTSMGKFVVGILQQVAELERKDIIDRTNLKLQYIKKILETKHEYVTGKGKVIKSLGRPKGSKDKNSKGRRKSGYLLRWQKSK